MSGFRDRRFNRPTSTVSGGAHPVRFSNISRGQDNFGINWSAHSAHRSMRRQVRATMLVMYLGATPIGLPCSVCRAVRRIHHAGRRTPIGAEIAAAAPGRRLALAQEAQAAIQSVSSYGQLPRSSALATSIVFTTRSARSCGCVAIGSISAMPAAMSGPGHTAPTSSQPARRTAG